MDLTLASKNTGLAVVSGRLVIKKIGKAYTKVTMNLYKVIIIHLQWKAESKSLLKDTKFNRFSYWIKFLTARAKWCNAATKQINFRNIYEN